MCQLMDSYGVVREDTHGTIRGNGVCLYVGVSFQYGEINCTLPNIVAVHLLDWNLWILTVYRPFSYDWAENTTLIAAIFDFCKGREVVILSDFNLPSLVWYSDVDLFREPCPIDKLFLDCFVSPGLTEWVMEGTFVSSGNILDLIFTSETARVSSV